MAAPAKEAQTFGALPALVKLLLGMLIVAVIALVYYFALHTPLVGELEAADGQNQQLRQQLAQAAERQREYLRVRAELDGRAAIDRQNKRVLPERAEIPAFLQDLNRLAELSGLHLELVEPRPDEVDTQYVKIPVSLAFSGHYHQVAKFFYNVSQLDRAISMENVRLSEPNVEGEEVTVKVAVLATTYRRPSTAETAAAPAAAPGAPATGGR
jgi:type IV pilus assembly protein PilO